MVLLHTNSSVCLQDLQVLFLRSDGLSLMRELNQYVADLGDLSELKAKYDCAMTYAQFKVLTGNSLLKFVSSAYKSVFLLCQLVQRFLQNFQMTTEGDEREHLLPNFGPSSGCGDAQRLGGQVREALYEGAQFANRRHIVSVYFGENSCAFCQLKEVFTLCFEIWVIWCSGIEAE